MNVKTLCLSILHNQESTGYEIRKQSTEGKYAYFVEASYGAIYPALAKLEDDGLVTSRVEQQDGKPAKKIYSITEAGRTSFQDSLFEELGEDVFRSEFLLFARFASILPASLVETRLRERMEMLDREIADLAEMLTDDTPGADRWIIEYGMSCMQVARQHIATHMHELIGLAKAGDDAALAAE